MPVSARSLPFSGAAFKGGFTSPKAFCHLFRVAAGDGLGDPPLPELRRASPSCNAAKRLLGGLGGLCGSLAFLGDLEPAAKDKEQWEILR